MSREVYPPQRGDELEWWEDTYVYLMKAGDYYKIGVSQNPKKRRGQMQSGCPLEIKVVLVVGMVPWRYGENLEKMVIEDLKDYHTRGEWFKIKDKSVVEDTKAAIAECVEKSQKEWRDSEPPYVSLPGRWE